MIAFTLFLDCLFMGLSWGFCLIAVTPAFNHFIQYGEAGVVLPSLSAILIHARLYMALVPLIWVGLSIFVYLRCIDKSGSEQVMRLLVFSLATICTGLTMILSYAVAAVLPYLKIGAVL